MLPITLQDETYMRLALQLAQGALGQTGVNPAVGCVIVKDGRVIGLGSHLRRGEAHAEIHALAMAGSEAEGSTVYVTLEPCSHYGKTPPCANRLIEEKVKRVVIAALDPNPQVAGSGAARLREHGIEVTHGLLEMEATELNEVFNVFITTGMPFVTLKTALTLDGKIASRTGDSKWITNAESRAFVHTLRHRHAAIMVGSGTVVADDPLLTARLEVPALQPTRIVVDARLRTPPNAAMLRDGAAPVYILTTDNAPREKWQQLEQAGAVLIPCGSGPNVSLQTAMKELAARDLSSILLEGGGKLNGAMLAEKLIHKIHLFIAPKIIGGGAAAPGAFDFAGFPLMADAIELRKLSVDRFGDDVCLTGYPDYTGGRE